MLPVLAATLAVTLIYVSLLIWVIPLNGLWSGDQGVKLIQIIALLQSKLHNLELPYPSAVLDPSATLSPLPTMMAWQYGGRYYSPFSYAYAVLTAIPFFTFGYPGLYVIPVGATTVTLAVTAALAKQIAPAFQWEVPLLLGLATPLGFYALVLWEHALAVCLTTLAVFCLIQAMRQQRIAIAFLSGVFASLAFWMRSETIWLAPALLAAVMWTTPNNRRLYGAYIIGWILGAMPLFIFNSLVFHHLLGPQVAVNYRMLDIANPATFLSLRADIFKVMVVDIAADVPFWSTAAIMILLVVSHRWIYPWLVLGVALMIIWGLLTTSPLSLRTGLVSTFPLVVFAARSGPQNSPQRLSIKFLVIAVLMYTIGVVLTAPNDGGAQWGPRYLLPVVPLVLLLSLNGVARLLDEQYGIPRSALILALVLVVVSSVWIQIRGVRRLQASAQDTLHIVQIVNTRPHQVVATDVWFGPQILAPLFFDHNVLWLSSPEKLNDLHALLQRNQISGFTYLSHQTLEQNEKALQRVGLQCAVVTQLPLQLQLLDCQLSP